MKKVIDRVLLIAIAIGGLCAVASFDIGLSLFGIQEIWRRFAFNAVFLFGLSFYFTYLFLKEEKIRRKQHIYFLTTLGFYFIFMSLIIFLDTLHIIPMEYLIGRAYRAWFTGMVYFAILLFIWIYIVEKFGSK